MVIVIKVGKYSYEEFREVAMKMLMESESMKDENLARAVVSNANIRDVIKIARLARNAPDVKLITRTITSSTNNKIK
jgi:hypothetical protein